MKFSPILFSSEMVNAILEGRKTQTRRTQGLELVNRIPGEFTHYQKYGGMAIGPYTGYLHQFWDGTGRGFFKDEIKHKYKVGDVLWVRETWKKSNPYGIPQFQYKAQWDSYNTGVDLSGWKPSIFMPKEACRLYLKIKSVKIEKLHDISEEDAISEGIEGNKVDGFKVYGKYGGRSCAQVSFESLWQKINGFEAWKSNPWVWVIEFERIDKPEKFN